LGYNKQTAFTLLELLITLSIFSFLTLAGVYYYQIHPNKTKLGLFANQFYVDLSYAKEQARIRQKTVRICPIEQNWTKGYEVNINSEMILSRTPPYPNTILIEAHFGLNQPCVYFDRRGQSLYNGHISYFYSAEKQIPIAKIIVTQTGKMHLSIN
jgi:prepilin-type N-terminal cleavage/methylation domain-containing protein